MLLAALLFGCAAVENLQEFLMEEYRKIPLVCQTKDDHKMCNLD